MSNPWKAAWEELDDMSGPLGIYGTMDDLAQKHGIPLVTAPGPLEARVSATEALEREVLRLQTLVSFAGIIMRDKDPQSILPNAMNAAVNDPNAWIQVADWATQIVTGYFPKGDEKA
jgi:hypothetical protein